MKSRKIKPSATIVEPKTLRNTLTRVVTIILAIIMLLSSGAMALAEEDVRSDIKMSLHESSNDGSEDNEPPDDLSNEPGDNEPSDEPGDNEQSDVPGDNEPPDEPGDNDPPNEPEDNEQSNEPEDNEQSNEPEDNEQSNEPEDNEPSNEPEDNEPSNEPETGFPPNGPDGIMPNTPAMDIISSTTANSPAPRTRAGIINQFVNFPYDLSKNDTFTTQPRLTLPLSAGVVSNKSLQNGLNSVNFVRFIAGLSPVQLNAEFTNKAQHMSTLLVYIGKGLDHNPPQPPGVSNEFYDMAFGTGRSENLAAGYNNIASSVIDGWMDSTTGHRQLVLYPLLAQVGFGITYIPSSPNGYSAMQSYNNQSYGPQPFDYVAWPAAVMPHHLYLQNKTFSITLFGYDSISTSSISIQVTSQKLNRSWNISGNQISLLASNTAQFRLPVEFATDDVLTIVVNGITKDGTASPITYKVEFFSMTPSTPRNLTATHGNGSVTLKWTAPSSNGGIAITRYEVSSSNGAIWVAASSNTSHTFNRLTNGTKYTFRVRAVNAAGNGATASVSATPVTVPEAPWGFWATPGNGRVKLEWSVPLNNGGSAILRYQVSKDKGATWVTASSNTSHTFTGLTNGTSYTFRVRAVNAVGNSAVASLSAKPDKPVTVPVTVPTAPRIFRAVPGNGRVELRWSAPSIDKGSEILWYEVSSNNGATWVSASSNTGHTFNWLTNGTSYKFRVRAVNLIGCGAEASVSAKPSKTAIKPTAPRSFTATPGNGRVVLKWTVPANNGGSSILRYQVSKDNGAKWVTASSNTSHTFTGLTNGKSYTFRVRAVNGVGNGKEISVSAIPVTVPGAPRSFRAAPGNGRVALNWAVPSSNGGSAILRYQVSKDNGEKWVTASSNTSHTFTGLTNGKSYTFRVRAVSGVGRSAEASLSAKPSATKIVPTAPRSFKATPGDRRVTLKWTVPGNNGGSSILRYQVSKDNGVKWVTASSKTSHTFTGLTNGTSYTFRVRAVNSIGNGKAASVSAKPSATKTAPTAPRSFKATPGWCRVTLSWDVPANNGGSSILRYQVSMDNGKKWVTASSNTSHTFTRLDYAKSYTFKVRAVNSIGNGKAASVSAKTTLS